MVAGYDVNETMDYPGHLQKNMNPLLTVALYGRTSMLSTSVARGTDLTTVNWCGVSSVWYAAKEYHLSTVEMLDGLGAAGNTSDNDGTTPYK